ncbi:hypothetical protein R1sor_027284 [Riccia sorocarpa]|uniref:F-box domain-containing protein n=1 Tax=Riccia sorocarpa TaxID=122646 RepID=A0ABD3GHF9_9MARC
MVVSAALAVPLLEQTDANNSTEKHVENNSVPISQKSLRFTLLCKPASSGELGSDQLGLMPSPPPYREDPEVRVSSLTVETARARISFSSSNSEKYEQHPQNEWSLCSIGDDSLSAVLSFLSPSDIIACARVCRYLRSFCKDDNKVWLPMCERRWGAQTSVQKWGRGKVLFRVLYSLLMKLDNLVGFWRGVGHGCLVIFEWGPHYVMGSRVVPCRPTSYEVHKIPFVWVGVSENGNQICLCDPDRSITPHSSEGLSSFNDCLKGESPGRLRRRNPFSELDSDWDLEQQTLPEGLIVVDLHFVGELHIVMEELQQPQFSGNRSLAEAAVVASFGSCGGSLAGGTSLSPSSGGSSSDMDRLNRSPPGSFQYEMYQFLASKITSQGGERIARKLRRRERERALLGRRVCEPEHFVKVRDVGPTEVRPLQGLWKGIWDAKGLDFVLLSYDERGGIVCRRVGEGLGAAHSGSVCWTAESGSFVRGPLSVHEQESFAKRQHFAPFGLHAEHQIQDGSDEEVVGMLCTLPVTGLDARAVGSEAEDFEGRVWQYASGRFGFGILPASTVVDFRPICTATGFLLDVLR